MKMGEAGPAGRGDARKWGVKMPHEPGIARALREARLSAGLGLREAARRAGCAPSYVSMLERGERAEPGERVLAALDEAFGLEAGELVRRAARYELRSMTRLDEGYRSGALSRLTARLGAVQVEAEAGVEAMKDGGLVRQVPLINCVAAGIPTEFTDLGYPARVADEYVVSINVNDPDAFAARVVGDSMQPKYVEGDVVIFSPSKVVKAGMDCFVRLEEKQETTFKRVWFFERDGEQMVRLEALNGKYAAREVRREQVAGMYAAVSVTREV